ncbi:CST complex subunit CTC1 isoform X2 [Centropristis striata]|nr:CST complex subunit CTC1 isoform X2 [Centropristis striata]
MELLQRLLDQFSPSGEAESTWLEEMCNFVSEQLAPLLSGPAPFAADDLLTGVCVCLVKKIQESRPLTHTLPVSYRPLCVSELLSQQHLSCVSNLSWSTNQQQTWAEEAELSVPGHHVLPRVSLLLIGCLTEGRGHWRLTDASGSVPCECLSPSPLWLNQPVFLPHWNYIPHDVAGQGEAGGYLELICSPVLLSPCPEQQLADGPEGGAGLSRAVGVREAAGLIQDRTRGQRVSVYGRVSSVCPLLVVAGTPFFVFWLTDRGAALPVLVKEPGRLWWAGRVCVGQSVCVTVLRVCVLRGWRGNNILCVTDRSEMHTDDTHTHAASPPPDTPPLLPDTPPPPLMSRADDSGEEAEPERDNVQSAVRMKPSRVISYQGTVTEVVSEGAGLYVIDRKVGLCLAYQPALRRNLRPGDTVELHHVHFLYRACPDLSPSMLCTCLRSSLRVTTFSRLRRSPTERRCPGDAVLPRLLLEKNMGVSEYLWTCHLSSQLSHSLVPSVLQQQCVCLLSWKLMECVLGQGRGRRRRDIYSEMLDEPHTCPLTQYRVDPAVHQYLSVSELLASLQSEWSSVSPPSDGSGLSRSWCCRRLASDPAAGACLRRRPLLLVGVLELPSVASGALQLRDGTAAIDCVVTETREEKGGGQRESSNTAWIGCLVCVQHFTMVTERLLQSDFPSDQHLNQDQYNTYTHCRVYLQFSLDLVHILSPSVAMGTHLQRRGDDVTAGGQPSGGKRRREEEEAGPSSSSSVTVATGCRPCASVVIRVQQKEGVAWRNTGAGLGRRGAGLTPCFSVRAAVIGPVVRWGRDPKNQPMMDREAGTEEQQVVLVLSGVAARWFPVLQINCFYRLITPNTQDPSVLIGCGVSGRSSVELHTDSTLQVRSDWRFHTLTRPLLLHTCTQALSPSVLSLSEVLDCRSELVCFQAQVLDRINLNDRTSESAAGVWSGVCSGVRLTVCDHTGRSLQVYLDLSHTPYPLGLLPGNTLLLSAFQRRVSRSGSVYFRSLPVSLVCVVSLGDLS